MAKKVKIKRKKKRDRETTLILTIIALLVIFILILGSLLLWSFFPNISKIFRQGEEYKDIENLGGLEDLEEGGFIIKRPLINSTRSLIYLTAVDEDKKGVITLLVVEAVPGSGRTLVNIDNLFFWADTQSSIRKAKNVAVKISKVDVEKYDLVYNIYANASAIGGESAGAAISIATIAALENITLRDDVIITGTVNNYGRIGLVGSVLPKAEAAKDFGATIFLVPLFQSTEVVYELAETCENGFCKTDEVPREANIEEEAGITVIEVGSIEDALQYFLK